MSVLAGTSPCVWHVLQQVITKKTDQGNLEPYENAYVEVPEEHVGPVVDLLGSRKGQMLDMSVTAEGLSQIKYRIPTRCCLCMYCTVFVGAAGSACSQLALQCC